jgi:hypothetical protein
MTYLMPYDLLTPRKRAQLQELADDQRRTGIDAVIYWLLATGVQRSARRKMAHRMMVSSVFSQAVALGLVSCAHCGDQGCDYCAQVVTR